MTKFYLILFLVLIPSFSHCQSKTFNQKLNDFEGRFNGNNKQRSCIIYNDLSQYVPNVKKQSIDWLGLYKNIIVDIPGETDSIIYVTCHYDKVDANIAYLINSWSNGFFDIIISPLYFSKGQYDNGTGVFISKMLIDTLKRRENKYTYRFLFTGMEEFGLRGSRRHVAGIRPEVWSKILYVINIDMAGGGKDSAVCVSSDVSDTSLIEKTSRIAVRNKHKLVFDTIKDKGGSDFEPFLGHNFLKDLSMSFNFNFIGVLFPQKSYFSIPKNTKRVINFTDKYNFKSYESFTILSPFAFSSIHSYKDNKLLVNNTKLYNYYSLISELIFDFEHQ